MLKVTLLVGAFRMHSYLKFGLFVLAAVAIPFTALNTACGQSCEASGSYICPPARCTCQRSLIRIGSCPRCTKHEHNITKVFIHLDESRRRTEPASPAADTFSDEEPIVVQSIVPFSSGLTATPMMAPMPMMMPPTYVMPAAYPAPLQTGYSYPQPRQSRSQVDSSCAEDLQKLAERVEALSSEVSDLTSNVGSLVNVVTDLTKTSQRHQALLEAHQKKLGQQADGTND